MRKLIGLALLFLSFTVSASEVNCYSGKTRIYHGYGSDFLFNDDFMVFKETGSSNLIVSMADCLVIVRVGEKLDATDQRKEG